MNRSVWACSFVVLVACANVPGKALSQESIEPSPPSTDLEQSKAASDTYGLAYAARSLVMPKGMIRGTFDVSGLRLQFFGASEIFWTLNFGVAITPVENLELGFSRYRMGSFPGINSLDLLGLGGQGLISVFVSPETDFGDIPFYLRYQATEGVADVAVEFRLRIPTFSELGIGFGVPLRIHAGDSVAIDTGFDLTFDDPGGVDLLSIGFPLDLVFNPSSNLFFKIQSGVSLPDLTEDPTIAAFPLGFTVGGSAPLGQAMLDAFLTFRFPIFGAVGGGESDLTTEIWTITIGINVYSPVLF